jgi:hypothetical protein
VAEWTALEWIGYATLWVAAVILAADTGLRMSTELRPRFTGLLNNSYWGFTPLILLTIGALAFVANEFHLIDRLLATTPDRHLTTYQSQRMKPELMLGPNENYSIEFNSVQNCDECEVYAQEFRDFVGNLTGWKAGGGTITFASASVPRTGLQLITGDKASPRLSQKLFAAFGAANITLTPGPSEPLQDLDAIIIVARRPK